MFKPSLSGHIIKSTCHIREATFKPYKLLLGRTILPDRLQHRFWGICFYRRWRYHPILIEKMTWLTTTEINWISKVTLQLTRFFNRTKTIVFGTHDMSGWLLWSLVIANMFTNIGQTVSSTLKTTTVAASRVAVTFYQPIHACLVEYNSANHSSGTHPGFACLVFLVRIFPPDAQSPKPKFWLRRNFGVFSKKFCYILLNRLTPYRCGGMLPFQELSSLHPPRYTRW